MAITLVYFQPFGKTPSCNMSDDLLIIGKSGVFKLDLISFSNFGCNPSVPWIC